MLLLSQRIGGEYMSQKLRQNRTLGESLWYLRREAGLTQNQVVAKLQLQGLNISRSMYSQMECGTYNIRISELDALVNLYHTDYNTLFMHGL